MKKNKILVIGCSAFLLFTGCSQTNEPRTPHEKKQQIINVTNNLPSWVLNPKVEGGISSVGITSYSKHGLAVMLPQAEMDGRSKLAGQIQTVVSQVQKRSMRNVKINEIDEFENSFKQASKEVIEKMPISGAQRTKIYQAKDGTLYVQMVIEKKEVSEHIGDMKDTYKQHMKDAKLSRKSIDEGMKVLDNMMEELEKEIN